MTKQSITAFYDSREYANNAALMLRQAGVPEADVTVSPESASAGYADTAEPHAKGFWASLEEMFGGTDDHSTYSEGVRRGGTLLTAHVDDRLVDDAVRILEQHGSVDLDERETTWRSEGWSGAAALADGQGAALRSSTSVGNRTELAAASPVAPVGTASVQAETARASDSAARATGRDDVVQVVEETLDVGKRMVNRGKVRLHSYVVETPVTEAVSLRNETVTIDRRPVNRPLAAAELGVDAFKDRTIEMDETAEEAVVAKTARVVEEIGIRKDVTDRTQTITDTVRSTKVDIDDGRTGTRVEPRVASLFAGETAIERAKGMDVVGSDGAHVGTVDHVDGTTIKLKRNDPSSGGSHHLIPTEWVGAVDDKVRLTIVAAEAQRRWTAA